MATLIRDRYEVLTTVGRGGEGEVVKALDRQHDRSVALKSRISGPGVDRWRVLSEARMLLSLEPHPNLPLVRDDFFEGDRHWLVMDWVEGRNLASLLADRPGAGLPPHEVLNAIEQVAAALDHLHRHDPPVVHRDLKPSNLIRQPDGRVVLVDFGVSSSTTGWGTRGFRAPELASGVAMPTADVYGLAATTFALLTGDRPRAGSEAWTNIPAGGVVERAIRRALATDPDRRYHSATAFVSELRRWLEPSMPEGTVTLLLTDVEGSVRLWEEHPQAMARALERHDEIVATAVSQHGGVLVKTKGEGDSTFAVFHHAADAVSCAARIQRRFRRERWSTPTPMRVRIAMHTGEAHPRDGDYFGPVVNRAARLRAAAHGGQTVLTAATAALIKDGHPDGTALVDLGQHRLRDLAEPGRIYEMRVDGIDETFPPLRSLDERPHNLPIELTTFIGRERELSEVKALLDRARTVTITGEGGAGKTRLALQVAAESGAAFEDGTWLIDLAPLVEPLTAAPSTRRRWRRSSRASTTGSTS